MNNFSTHFSKLIEEENYSKVQKQNLKIFIFTFISVVIIHEFIEILLFFYITPNDIECDSSLNFVIFIIFFFNYYQKSNIISINFFIFLICLSH